MTISVGLQGSTRLAKRLADAIASQSDMRLAGVSGWTDLERLASARGYTLADSADQLATECDVLVDVDETSISVHGAGEPCRPQHDNQYAPFTALASHNAHRAGETLYVPGADVVALARIVRQIQRLGHITRLYSNVVSRGAHATEEAPSGLDALEPITGKTDCDSWLDQVFAGIVPVCQIRRVIAPYTHSHLHMIKLDMDNAMERDTIATVLGGNSRILVATAQDGFRSTADINEFFRDLGRSRGDRWEAFVWEQSIMSLNQSVCLMLDISPDAVPIPEGIDAIRRVGRPELRLPAIQQITDESLGLIPNFAN